MFYIAPDARLMSVAVSRSPSGLAFGVPRALFRMPLGRSLGVGGQSYAVSRDGQRFLVLASPGRGRLLADRRRAGAGRVRSASASSLAPGASQRRYAESWSGCREMIRKNAPSRYAIARIFWLSLRE